MLVVLTALTLLIGQEPVTPAIPPGVRYKAASPELNTWAHDMLATAFSPNGKRFGEALFYGNVVTCGPFLWKEVSASGVVTSAEKGRTIFMVMGAEGKTVAMAGRRFFAGDVAEFQKAMDGLVPAGTYEVRAPSAAELKFYWSMISYDIAAPIFTVEGEGHRFLVDFFGSEHLFLIEDVTAVGSK